MASSAGKQALRKVSPIPRRWMAVSAGNAMKPFAGIDDTATRKAIIDFLKGA